MRMPAKTGALSIHVAICFFPATPHRLTVLCFYWGKLVTKVGEA